MSDTVAVIGLGYVGLPVAVGFAQTRPVVGFDIDETRIAQLREGVDRTGEVPSQRLTTGRLTFTSNKADLAAASVYVVTVPTPINTNRQPNLDPLIAASRSVGPFLKPGDLVVFESTVFPGVTEEICGPVLAECSGLRQGVDFELGYSPERINPGDHVHRLETITKVVSGDSERSLERVAELYLSIVDAGVHRAPSIKVAEAAKVIENTQRDLNIALMNELALIFDRMGIRTADVLAAAGTKWNFMPFTPGLVGGHCIGVDPYYLTAKAELLGYHPQVILSGRRINDGMGEFIAQKLIKLLIAQGKPVKGARVGILGLTFKEDVPDLRNSRVPDIVHELVEFGVEVLVHDPLADAKEALREYSVELQSYETLRNLDGLVLAVPHEQYVTAIRELPHLLQREGVLIDVKSVCKPTDVPEHVEYWSL